MRQVYIILVSGNRKGVARLTPEITLYLITVIQTSKNNTLFFATMSHMLLITLDLSDFSRMFWRWDGPLEPWA